MAVNASAGRAAEVQAQIHPVRLVRFADCGLDTLRQRHHFVQRFHVTLRKLRHMLIRHHHHVARGVRIAVQNDEVLCGAVHDERFHVIFGSERGAENALCFFTGGLGQVLVTPRRPEVVHRAPSAFRNSRRKDSAKPLAEWTPCEDWNETAKLLMWSWLAVTRGSECGPPCRTCLSFVSRC